MFPTERPRATGKRSICSNSSAEIDRCLFSNPTTITADTAFISARNWMSASGSNAIEKALSADYIVQDALDLHPEVFPIFSETDWKLQPMFVDTNPFLFRGKVCGAMVRLSATPIVNVTSGGGETGFFVLQ